jgi:hypothetical protein
MLTLSRTAYSMCAMLLMPDLDTQRAHRLHGFGDAQLIRATRAHCVAGNVDGAGEIEAVIESVRPHTKHAGCAIAPVPAGGAGGSGMG